MTVGELVAKLQAMPQDAIVIRQIFSDYDEMPQSDPVLWTVESKRLARWKGQLMNYDSRIWPKDFPESAVEFVQACYFSGN